MGIQEEYKRALDLTATRDLCDSEQITRQSNIQCWESGPSEDRLSESKSEEVNPGFYYEESARDVNVMGVSLS
jgi:hypothetical protein